MVNQEKVNAFKTNLDNTYEKVANKKNDITGDYSQDNASFPTVQAVKSFQASAFNALHAVATSGDYEDLENAPDFSVVKQATAEEGYASTYYFTVDGVQVGSKINIEKDKMLRSVSVETVGATPSSEESALNLSTGDQYILMVVNTVDNDGTTNLILPITDVFDLQTADETTLTLSSGVFSIKAGGVSTTCLADGSVTTAKIADANVTADKLASDSVTTAKITDANVTYAKLSNDCITSLKSDMDDEIDAFFDALNATFSS